MYGRKYGEKELNFEASGGLIHASLVMQDKETSSYWSIMTGDALAGDFKGTPLVEMSHGTKAQWSEWKAKHPRTLVLSVEGVEHVEESPYDKYFSSPDGFRGAAAGDDRLPTKEPIYAFQMAGRAFAIPYEEFVGGAVFETADQDVFLYRPADAEIFSSTVAYQAASGSFENRDGVWRHHKSGAVFDPATRRFVPAKAPTADGTVDRLSGFDTFWFNWSMTHPKTEIVRGAGK